MINLRDSIDRIFENDADLKQLAALHPNGAAIIKAAMKRLLLQPVRGAGAEKKEGATWKLNRG